MSGLQAEVKEAVKAALMELQSEVGGMFAPAPKPILTIKEAAEYLGRSESGVRKLIREGAIPAGIVRRLGGQQIIVRNALDKWLVI